MSVRLNNAGAGASDPMLAGDGTNGVSDTGLGLEIRIACTSMDLIADKDSVAGRPNLFVGQSPNPTGNDQKSNLSPDAIDKAADGSINGSNVLTSATVGSWDTDIGSGDWIYLSHGSITDGLYSVSARSGTDITLGSDYTDGAQTGVSFQIGWRWETDTHSSPLAKTDAGQINYVKAWGEDLATNEGSSEESFYIRENQSDIVELDSGAYQGQTTGSTSVGTAFMSSWTNKGGAVTVAVFDNVLGEGGGDGDITEITETSIGSVSTVTLLGSDGQKNFDVRFRAKSGSTDFVTVQCTIILDTTAPTLSIDAVAI